MSHVSHSRKRTWFEVNELVQSGERMTRAKEDTFTEARDACDNRAAARAGGRRTDGNSMSAVDEHPRPWRDHSRDDADAHEPAIEPPRRPPLCRNSGESVPSNVNHIRPLCMRLCRICALCAADVGSTPMRGSRTPTAKMVPKTQNAHRDAVVINDPTSQHSTYSQCPLRRQHHRAPHPLLPSFPRVHQVASWPPTPTCLYCSQGGRKQARRKAHFCAHSRPKVSRILGHRYHGHLGPDSLLCML